MKKLFLKQVIWLIVFFACVDAQAAVLYLKSAGGNWSAAGTWSTVSAAGGDNSGPPVATTDVIMELLSGNVTIDAGAVCRSLDTTSGTGTYGGVVTHNSAVALTIGDGTAGAGNVALKFNSGMTYTLGSGTTSSNVFASTSGTQQTITSGGKTLGAIIVSGSGSSYLQNDDITSAGVFTFSNGTWANSNKNLTAGSFASTAGTRTLNLLASTNTFTSGNFSFSGASSTLNAGTSVINMQGASVTFTPDNYDVFNTLNFTGSGTHTLNAALVASNFTYTGTTSKTGILSLTSNLNVLVNFTLAGNSVTNRVLIQSSVLGSSRMVTNLGAAMSWSNVDFKDIALSSNYDASAITGLSGDAGGNSGITFTTMVTNSAIGTASFLWSSTTNWNTRVPLPQDDVFVTNSFVAGRAVTWDMPRVGRNVSFNGALNTPGMTFTASPTIYGSLDTTSVSPTHTSGGNVFQFESRTNSLLTTGPFVWGGGVTFAMFGGSMTMQDNFNGSAAGSTVAFANGIFDANGKNVTIRRVVVSASTTRTLLMGTGTWTLNSASAEQVWAALTPGLTFVGTNATIIISNTTLAKSFAGAGMKYGHFSITGTGSGAFDIIGNTNSWRTFTVGAPNTIRFTAATTNFFEQFISIGNASSTNTISSITAATHYLSQPSGSIAGQYNRITNSAAQGGATWYAGTNSVDLGGNSGWIFTNDPASAGTGNLMLLGIGN